MDDTGVMTAKMAVAAVLACTGLMAGPVCAYTDVTVTEAHAMWTDGTFVLDVRTPGEFADGHIPGAYNIPVSDIDSRVDEIIDRQDDDILVYCASGNRSRTGSAELESSHEFTGIHNMEGGSSVWQSAGNETAVVVMFGDETIEGQIREDIEKLTGLIRSNELVNAGIDDITAINSRVTDLSGIEYCTDLETIDLSRNSIVDIGPLENLTNLTHLRIDQNRIDDISAVENLTGLVELRMDFNEISDVQPLENLTGLTYFELNGNLIDSVDALGGLTNLEFLSLGENLIEDVDPLGTLLALTSLNIESNSLENIEAVATLTSLVEIDLSGNRIRDIEPLTGLPDVRDLNLTDNLITDISGFAVAPGIGDVDILRIIGNPLSNDALCDDIPTLETVLETLEYTGECDADADGDGLADEYEVYIGIQATESDTDGDALDDGNEVIVYVTDPLNTDTDGDGIGDGDEVYTYATNPKDPDSDDDGMQDGWEVSFGMSPIDPDGENGPDGDIDDDGVLNGDEYVGGTDPTDADSDGDGVPDGQDTAGADLPPVIELDTVELTAYEDVATGIDLTPFETDDNDTGTDLTWSISGVDTSLFSADVNAVTDVLTIVSEPDLSGSDLVTLTLTDSHGQTDSEDVLITVLPVNDAPVCSGLPDIEFLEDTTYSLLELDDYVEDIDNAKTELVWSATQFGNLEVVIDPSTNVATVKSKFNDWWGTDEVPFACTDPEGLSDTDVVAVTVLPVNDPPRFRSTVPDLIVDVNFGRMYNIGQHATDIDDDDTTLLWSVSDVNESLFDAKIAPAGFLQISPILEAEGSDRIRLVVSDDESAEAEQWITVTVTMDVDGDGMPNDWEDEHGLDQDGNDAGDDPDRDGLTNIEEYALNTNPRTADTDGDGYTDGEEAERDTDPNETDDMPDPWLTAVTIDPVEPEVWIEEPFFFSVTGEMRDGTVADLSAASVTWERADGVGEIDSLIGTFESDRAGESTVAVTVVLDGETVGDDIVFIVERRAVISVADADVSNSAESEIPIKLNAHGLNVTEVRFDLLIDQEVVSLVDIRAGEVTGMADKTVNAASNAQNSYAVFVGGNATSISDGNILTVTVAAADVVAENECIDAVCADPVCRGPDDVSVPVVGGSGRWCLALGWDPADVDRNNHVDASDIQRVINSALGLGGCVFCDIDRNDVVNAVDVQMAINAVLNIP